VTMGGELHVAEKGRYILGASGFRSGILTISIGCGTIAGATAGSAASMKTVIESIEPFPVMPTRSHNDSIADTLPRKDT